MGAPDTTTLAIQAALQVTRHGGTQMPARVHIRGRFVPIEQVLYVNPTRIALNFCFKHAVGLNLN